MQELHIAGERAGKGQGRRSEEDGEACTETKTRTDIESRPQHLMSDLPIKSVTPVSVPLPHDSQA
jgi:hypothetical protein